MKTRGSLFCPGMFSAGSLPTMAVPVKTATQNRQLRIFSRGSSVLPVPELFFVHLLSWNEQRAAGRIHQRGELIIGLLFLLPALS